MLGRNENGKAPVTLKWVDRDKSDAANPVYRSRLHMVVREIKRASKPLEEHESYSAMPPLEALKTFVSDGVQASEQQRKEIQAGAHRYFEGPLLWSFKTQGILHTAGGARTARQMCTSEAHHVWDA